MSAVKKQGKKETVAPVAPVAPSEPAFSASEWVEAAQKVLFTKPRIVLAATCNDDPEALYTKAEIIKAIEVYSNRIVE